MGFKRRELMKAAMLGAPASLLAGYNKPVFAQGASSATGKSNQMIWNRPVTITPDQVLPLWPEGAITIPEGLTEEIVQRNADPLESDRMAQKITNPRLEIFRPSKPSGAAMIIAPGGGYHFCVMDKEGYELGRLLRDRGVTVYVLFYRLPSDGWANRSDVPLTDAQRAVRLVRSRAKADGIDPSRLAFMGFSAGGHVATSLLTRFDAAVYQPVDSADTASARPDAVAGIYPVVSMDPAIAHGGSRRYLIGSDPTAEMTKLYSPEQNTRKDMPPLFLLHAEDDKIVPVQNSVNMRAAAIANGIACESHFFERGSHGFGLMKTAGLPIAIWPELLWNWMGSHNLI